MVLLNNEIVPCPAVYPGPIVYKGYNIGAIDSVGVFGVLGTRYNRVHHIGCSIFATDAESKQKCNTT